MPLKQYQKKRKFSETPEPKGKEKKSKSKKLIFVIHKHHASHLHWDLRLEIGGVLKSWAVPKEPPKTKNVKRLAIQVEDHPINYAKFEGIIPKGNYGAGKVEIWDKGNYRLKEKTKDKIEFILYGKKLNGNFVLVRTHYGNKPEKSWLFFKI
ncbi:Multifunctional non-homologous end joining protein LigD [subsurface metagenome]